MIKVHQAKYIYDNQMVSKKKKIQMLIAHVPHISKIPSSLFTQILRTLIELVDYPTTTTTTSSVDYGSQ